MLKFAPMKPYERLEQPLIRRGKNDPLTPCTWDEALAAAARGLDKARKKGPDAFGLFSCSKSTNEMNYAAGKFARVVMGSSNIDSCNRT